MSFTQTNSTSPTVAGPHASLLRSSLAENGVKDCPIIEPIFAGIEVNNIPDLGDTPLPAFVNGFDAPNPRFFRSSEGKLDTRALSQLDMDTQMHLDFDADGGPGCSLLPIGAMDNMWVTPGLFPFGAVYAQSHEFKPCITLDDVPSWPEVDSEEDLCDTDRHPAAEELDPTMEELVEQYGGVEAGAMYVEQSSYLSASDLEDDTQQFRDALEIQDDMCSSDDGQTKVGIDEELAQQKVKADSESLTDVWLSSKEFPIDYVTRSYHQLEPPHHTLCGASRYHHVEHDRRGSFHHHRAKSINAPPKTRRPASRIPAQAAHRESIKTSSKRPYFSARQDTSKKREHIAFTVEQIHLLCSRNREREPEELPLNKPLRVEKGPRARAGWKCEQEHCSQLSCREAVARRHILTHLDLHIICFGCHHSFGSRVSSLKRHVEQVRRKNKASACVQANPSVEKKTSNLGMADRENKGPWQEDSFMENATVIERDPRLEGGARLVRIKWV